MKYLPLILSVISIGLKAQDSIQYEFITVEFSYDIIAVIQGETKIVLPQGTVWKEKIKELKNDGWEVIDLTSSYDENWRSCRLRRELE